MSSENKAVPRRGPVVAIDGPAGAGKSTVAAHLAHTFHLLNLETGAMYRALALKCSRCGIDPESAESVSALTKGTRIHLEPHESVSRNRVLLDGEDVTSLLRTPEITEMASRVSVHPEVRRWMVAEQRNLGANGGVVMEGRDIGTEVFPDADVKIFLDASPEMRGERRFEQVAGKTTESLEATVREMKERDQRDRTRADSPLRPAEDAVLIDTTSLSLDEVLAKVASLIQPYVH